MQCLRSGLRTFVRLSALRDVARNEVGRNLDRAIPVAHGFDFIAALSEGSGCCAAKSDDDCEGEQEEAFGVFHNENTR